MKIDNENDQFTSKLGGILSIVFYTMAIFFAYSKYKIQAAELAT